MNRERGRKEGKERGEGKRGRKGGKEKREPVGMPKDFDFHIDVMFKLTYWVASTTTAANFE